MVELHTDVDFLSRHVPDTEEGLGSDKHPDNEYREEESNALIIHQISLRNHQGQAKRHKNALKQHKKRMRLSMK